MHRNTFSAAAMLALMVGAGGQVERPPLARDDKPARPQRSPLYGYYGIPFPHLKHVSRETLNRPHQGGMLVVRAERRARRKARMRLRKRRGWR